MTEPRQDTVENVAEAIAAEIDAIDAELENVSALAVPCRDELRREASQRIARAAINAMSDVREALEGVRPFLRLLTKQGDSLWRPAERNLAKIDAALESLSGRGK